MLDLEVTPETSIGNEIWKFLIGMPFQQAVDILRRQDNVIRNIQVLYSDKIPLHMNLEINLANDGIKLIFDSELQRLQQIEIFDLTKVKLKYYGCHFNNPPSILPTIDQIYQNFTCTTPGDTNGEFYILHYRGISFSFAALTGKETHATFRSNNVPNGYSPLVTKINIFLGNCLTDAKGALPIPLQCYHGGIYLDRLEVKRENGEVKEFNFDLLAEALYQTKTGEPEKENLRTSIQFGDTVEDVLSAIGSPMHVFFKSEDKMKIHSPDGHKRIHSRKADYFFNYFTLGMDLLFDAHSHRLKKVVLHTNFPGHYNFNTYYRCNFILPMIRNKGSSNCLIPACQSGSGLCTEGSTGSVDIVKLNVTPSTKWDMIQEFLNRGSHILESPVILKRNSAPNTSNPFGPTYCYGYGDIIFEVIPSCNHLASLTICSMQDLSAGSRC